MTATKYDRTENLLKGEFRERLKRRHPSWVYIPHQDLRTPGVPDVSVTGDGLTTWLEFKRARPWFKSPGPQEMTMRRLWIEGGNAYYVIYGDDSTFLVLPSCFPRGPAEGGVRTLAELNAPNFSASKADHDFVIDWLEHMRLRHKERMAIYDRG